MDPPRSKQHFFSSVPNMSGKGEVEQLSGVQFLHWKIYGAKFPWELALHSFYTLSLSFLSELKELLFHLLLFAYMLYPTSFFALTVVSFISLMSYLFVCIFLLYFLYNFLLFMYIFIFFFSVLPLWFLIVFVSFPLTTLGWMKYS